MAQKSESTAAVALTPEERLEAREREREALARRAERRASVRFWLKVIAAAAFVAFVVLGGGRAVDYVINLPAFSFTRLEVSGDIARVPVARVKEAVEPVLRGNYFTEDLDKVRDAVEQVPWVREAVVRRVFPDELQVSVTTYTPAAIFEDGRLVSEDGKLFAANPEEREDPSSALPTFSGPESQVPEIARHYKEYKKAVTPLKAEITAVTLSARGSWGLTVKGPGMPPTHVEIGQETAERSTADRLAAFVNVYPKVKEILNGPPASVDLRYNKAFAATLPARGEEAGEAEAAATTNDTGAKGAEGGGQ
jgi:cell division protein FtsQ